MKPRKAGLAFRSLCGLCLAVNLLVPLLAKVTSKFLPTAHEGQDDDNDKDSTRRS